MERSVTYVILILMMVIWSAVTAVTETTNQKFAIEPESLSATIGSKIVLPCRVIGKQGVLQWTKDDFGLGTHRNLTAFDRYAMVGVEEDGDHNLRIENIQLEDDAKYQCQVSPGPQGQPGIRSRFASLTVLVPPEPPKITQGSYLLTRENKEIELECVSVGGKPVAELTWIDGSGNVLTKGIKIEKEPLPDGKRFTARSTLKMKPQKKHHNMTFTCQAKNLADKSAKSTEIKLEVLFAPKLKMSVDKVYQDDATVYSVSDGIPEGSEAHFKCNTVANPPDVTYKWFINDELVVGDYTTEMVIHRTNRSQHNAIVKCEATNDIATKAEIMKLNIIYAPVFKHLPKSVEAEEGDDVVLECEVDGNPLEIFWVHDPIDRLNYHPSVIGTENKLELTVTNETAGRYFCKASVPGFPEIKAEAGVYLKQAPQIMSPSYQYGVIGDTLRLECYAISVPKARHISWSFKGREINTSGDHEFSILEEPTPQGIKSTLIIRNSQAWHFDKYNCSVVNDYGTDVLQVDLLQAETIIRQIRSNLPIFLTVVIVAVLILIVVVCFIYIKTMGRRARQTKKEKEFAHHNNYMMGYPDDNSGMEKCCKDSDRSSPSSVYKIKQGSSESNYSLPSNASDNTLIQIISNNGISYEKPVAYRQSITYDDEEAYYTSKEVPGPYGSITAIKNRRSMDYDDDRYYISNNIRNSLGYGFNPNPSIVHQRQHSQPVVMSNYATNRYVSHPAIITPSTEPRQDVGLPRSSIV